MIINGEGITEFNLQIHRDFTINTTLSLRFFDLWNGGMGCVDRTADEDTYESVINVMGTKEQIITLLQKFESNRTVIGSNQRNILTLSSFNSGEYIFGADIDYTVPIVCMPFIERRAQRIISTNQVEIRLVAQNLSFVTPQSSSFPDLHFVSIGYDGDTDKSVNKLLSLNNSFLVKEHSSDRGTWSGTVQLNHKSMVQLRSFARTNRGSSFNIPQISGVDRPFGTRNSTGTKVKLIEIGNDQVIGYNCGEPVWMCDITLAEQFD